MKDIWLTDHLTHSLLTHAIWLRGHLTQRTFDSRAQKGTFNSGDIWLTSSKEDIWLTDIWLRGHLTQRTFDSRAQKGTFDSGDIWLTSSKGDIWLTSSKGDIWLTSSKGDIWLRGHFTLTSFAFYDVFWEGTINFHQMGHNGHRWKALNVNFTEIIIRNNFEKILIIKIFQNVQKT